MIDNATIDGTAEWARSMYPQVVTLRKEPPLSVAASWNKGLSLLYAGTHNDNILVINNDVELPPQMYRWLMASKDEFVTGVGVDTREQMEAVMKSADAQAYHCTPHPDFSCFMMRRSVWNKVGKFDENFKGAFAEDWDFHVRLHKAGITAMSIGVPFYHVGSATIKSMDATSCDALCKQADLNRQYFYNKWGMHGGSKEYEDFFKSQSCEPSTQ
jgi:hypothetical protein